MAVHREKNLKQRTQREVSQCGQPRSRAPALWRAVPRAARRLARSAAHDPARGSDSGCHRQVDLLTACGVVCSLEFEELPLHSAVLAPSFSQQPALAAQAAGPRHPPISACAASARSEEHTSELQSHLNIVCRLLLEKKKFYAQAAITYQDLTR